MGVSNKLPGGADVAGPRTTRQAVYLVHLHTNFEESSGETEELGAAMGSTQYVKEPADGQKPRVAAVPTGFKTNFRQFSYEQMSVLLQSCCLGGGSRPLQGQRFLS